MQVSQWLDYDAAVVLGLACYWYHSNLLSQQRKQSLATLTFLCHATIFQIQVINLILNIKDKLMASIATVLVGQVTVSH